MADKFHEIVFTDSVRKAQAHYYGKSQRVEGAPERDALTEDETGFIQSRDSFYMATVSETGWPYVQHRGGKPGFLRVINPTSLAFADYKGNRQLLTTGNLAVTDRVTLFLMDYPQRTRLKILGHARVEDARQHPELVAQLADPRTDNAAFEFECDGMIGLSGLRNFQHKIRFEILEIDPGVRSFLRRLG